MKITFIAADGTETLVDAPEGESVMRAAVGNDVDGIIGECGGSMMCATCHCAASEVKPTSRLSCQIRIRPDLDGIVIHLPEAQL